MLEHNALWITEEGRPLTKHGIQQIMRRLKHDAGLSHLKGSVHKLRHTGATITLKHTRDMPNLDIGEPEGIAFEFISPKWYDYRRRSLVQK